MDNLHRMNEHQIKAVAQKVAGQIEEMSHAVHVEDIQDMVETGIMEMRGYEVAQKYVRYRYKRELTRKSNTAGLYGRRGQQGSDEENASAGRCC